MDTEYQRALFAVGATGYDPSDIVLQNGMTLPEAVYNEVGNQEAMSRAAFKLISLDAVGYVPEGADPEDTAHYDPQIYEEAVATRARWVTAVALGRWQSYQNGALDAPMDLGGMFAQALSHYYDPEPGTIYYDVAARVQEEYGIDLKVLQDAMADGLAKKQDITGGWRLGSAICSSAQSVVFLSQIGKDVTEDPYITNAGYTPFELHVNATGFHPPTWEWDEAGENLVAGSLNDGMSVYQGAYANVAWLRMINDMAPLYDYTDVYGVTYVNQLIHCLPETEEAAEEDADAIQTCLLYTSVRRPGSVHELGLAAGRAGRVVEKETSDDPELAVNYGKAGVLF